jgi:hypothetical protein
MSVITISREFGSEGDEIAQNTAFSHFPFSFKISPNARLKTSYGCAPTMA